MWTDSFVEIKSTSTMYPGHSNMLKVSSSECDKESSVPLSESTFQLVPHKYTAPREAVTMIALMVSSLESQVHNRKH